MDRRNTPNLPPGLRNNNPGNIRLTNINWLGKIPNNENTSGVHEQFISSAYGTRALMKQILSTTSRAGTDPVQFVQDYAAGSSPSVLANYANFIKNFTGTSKINTDKNGLTKTAQAITIFENGTPGKLFAQSEFEAGYNLLNATNPPDFNQKKEARYNPLLIVAGLAALLYI